MLNYSRRICRFCMCKLSDMFNLMYTYVLLTIFMEALSEQILIHIWSPPDYLSGPCCLKSGHHCKKYGHWVFQGFQKINNISNILKEIKSILRKFEPVQVGQLYQERDNKCEDLLSCMYLTMRWSYCKSD